MTEHEITKFRQIEVFTVRICTFVNKINNHISIFYYTLFGFRITFEDSIPKRECVPYCKNPI